MSCPAEADEVKDPKFNWGKKRGVGGKRKEVQFYESFTYDGVEYTLHDCVYLYKEGEPEPYIGKLLKIWKNSDNSKKIKVLWFFRPREIWNWLGDEETPSNELFLACGEGVGLSNINSLEAIAGKCNVVCISKDKRNPQLPEEELQTAEYVFYRTFDVRHHTISDKLGDKIAGVDVKYFFNREEYQKPSECPKIDSNRKETLGNELSRNADETPVHSKQNPSEEFKANKSEADVGMIHANQVKEEKLKSIKYSDDLDGRPSKKAKVDSFVKSFEDKKTNATQKPSIYSDGFDVKGVPTIAASKDKAKTELHKDYCGPDKGLSKNLKSVEKLSNGKLLKRNASLSQSPDDDNKVDDRVVEVTRRRDAGVSTIAASKDKMETELDKDYCGLDKGLYKKLKSDEKLSNGKLLKGNSSLRQSPVDDNKGDYRVVEVTRRPDAERSRWFKGLPWEERMQNAHKQGTLVLLENLDPSYTSADVEDIVYHGFKESSTAKMIQRTAICSPHSGQAFVIFKSREAAEKVVRKLEDECLMLSNGRPLVGSIGTPCFPRKESTLVGHLVIDKVKIQMQRDMKAAVSTSHYSQPNTIEYEMAMEWCLLQERSDIWWKTLYKKQGEEIKKVRAELKSK